MEVEEGEGGGGVEGGGTGGGGVDGGRLTLLLSLQLVLGELQAPGPLPVM